MNQKKQMLFRRLVTLMFAVVTGFAFSLAHGQVVADFSGGLGNQAPNEFPGSGGQGWAGGWQTTFVKGTMDQFSFSVEKDSSFVNGPDVLQVARKGDQGFARISRIVDVMETPPGGSQEVSFQVRLDEFTGSADQPFLFTLAGFSQEHEKDQIPANSNWCLIVTERDPTWAIYHGDSSTGRLVRLKTDIPLEVGVVYSVKIHLQPDQGLFRVILESGSHFYESPQLSSASAVGMADLLSFTGWVAQGGPGQFRWSLGAVRVRDLPSQ